MTLVTVSQSADGENANAADVNGPVNALAAALNGNLDDTNMTPGGLTDTSLATGYKQSTRWDYLPDCVLSGCVWTATSGLGASMTGGFVLIDGIYCTVSSTTKTFTASKDTYVQLQRSGTTAAPVYVEVANGATVGMTLGSNSIVSAKVVTSGAAVTGITQIGGDPLGNIINNKGIVSAGTTVVPYKFRTYRAAAQNTSAGTFVKISFDTKTYDTGANYDNVANFRFTSPMAGFYQFNASVQLSSSSSSGVLSLYKNGAEISRGGRGKASADLLGLTVSDTIQLAATDYVEVFVFCSSTLALDVIATTNNYFSGYMVSVS